MEKYFHLYFLQEQLLFFRLIPLQYNFGFYSSLWFIANRKIWGALPLWGSEPIRGAADKVLWIREEPGIEEELPNSGGFPFSAADEKFLRKEKACRTGTPFGLCGSDYRWYSLSPAWYWGSQVRLTPSFRKTDSSTWDKITEECTSQPRSLESCSSA